MPLTCCQSFTATQLRQVSRRHFSKFIRVPSMNHNCYRENTGNCLHFAEWLEISARILAANEEGTMTRHSGSCILIQMSLCRPGMTRQKTLVRLRASICCRSIGSHPPHLTIAPNINKILSTLPLQNGPHLQFTDSYSGALSSLPTLHIHWTRFSTLLPASGQ